MGAFNTLYNVRAGISRHIATVNLGFFTNNTSGEIKKVIIEDVERIEKFLAHQIPDITAAVFAPLLMFVYLLTLSVPMALCLLAPVVIGGLVQVIATFTGAKHMVTYHRLIGKLNSTIMQFINGMPVMKTYNMTAEGYKEYADTVTEYNSFWKACTRDQGYTYGIFVALVQSGVLFALPLGGWLFLCGSLPVETYLFFMIMSMVFLSSLLNLMNFSQMFNQIMSGVSRIKNIMDLPRTTEGSRTLEKARPHSVGFENVTFSYDKTDVLKNVNLTLPAGSFTAFVGASGAGKTTAAQLIPKFWEVTKGCIRIDDDNIIELRTDNLMDLVSFVFQETFMLNDTIYQNIAIGSKTATRAQVENAAKAAQIHDFITGLPAGYDTKLGEDGVKMSGGEKQRLCIARAILKDAPIIVFDEATSYTDIENEYKIQLALGELLRGKTTIMIAHRLHTIVNADAICVFDKGAVTEQGTHQGLIAQNGLYARMWKTYTQNEQEAAS
ncbi:ABC transporter ATP-binding protein/permease [Clostridia bacterium OttesenSCG-928-O13]|nr:ABC transporter ATP-binding protein/permease [Clostridia bacterium OttesenSCG-928-O13]